MFLTESMACRLHLSQILISENLWTEKSRMCIYGLLNPFTVSKKVSTPTFNKCTYHTRQLGFHKEEKYTLNLLWRQVIKRVMGQSLSSGTAQSFKAIFRTLIFRLSCLLWTSLLHWFPYLPITLSVLLFNQSNCLNGLWGGTLGTSPVRGGLEIQFYGSKTVSLRSFP